MYIVKITNGLLARCDMKKVFIGAVLISLVLIGCVFTSESVRSMNRTRLNQLQLGMNKQEVLKIMGTRTIQTYSGSPLSNYPDMKINNPYRSEAYTSNNRSVLILYYYTDQKRSDNAVTDDELTPIVFEDAVLVGWGWSYINDVEKKYEIRIR